MRYIALHPLHVTPWGCAMIVDKGLKLYQAGAAFTLHHLQQTNMY